MAVVAPQRRIAPAEAEAEAEARAKANPFAQTDGKVVTQCQQVQLAGRQKADRETEGKKRQDRPDPFRRSPRLCRRPPGSEFRRLGNLAPCKVGALGVNRTSSSVGQERRLPRSLLRDLSKRCAQCFAVRMLRRPDLRPSPEAFHEWISGP
jgi:hypothetical protein